MLRCAYLRKNNFHSGRLKEYQIMDAPKQQPKSEHIWAQFSAEDFDAKQWVNNVLRTRKDKEPDTSVDVCYKWHDTERAIL